jgi:hypothetical protein
MATLSGGVGGDLYEVIWLYFPKMSIDFINTFVHDWLGYSKSNDIWSLT